MYSAAIPVKDQKRYDLYDLTTSKLFVCCSFTILCFFQKTVVHGSFVRA